MMYFSLLTLLGLSQVLLQCKGQISVTSDKKTYYVLPGEDVGIIWKISGIEASNLDMREWRLLKPNVILAFIDGTGKVTRNNKTTLGQGFEVREPSTLYLNVVDERYDGKYQFSIREVVDSSAFVVTVIVLITPKIVVNCSSLTTVNQSDYFACECRGTDGNPPANVTWYKNNTKIVTGKEEAILVFNNISKDHNGTYKCVAKSHEKAKNETSIELIVNLTPVIAVSCSSVTTVNQSDNFVCKCEGKDGNPPADVTWYKDNKKIVTGKEEAILVLNNVNKDNNGTYICKAKSSESAKNETSIELIVNYPPENVKIDLTRRGPSVTMTCTAKARPAPSFKIFLDETKLVVSDKTYTIPEVNISFVGNYTCVAENILGNKSSYPRPLRIEVKPVIKVNCSIVNNVNEDDYFACQCNGTGGYPSAIVTWLKNNTEITTGKENAILVRRNVKQEDNGTYKCEAKSSEKAKDDITIYLNVNPVPPKPKPKPTSEPGPPVAIIVGIVVGVLVLILIIVVVLYYCKKRARNGYKGNANVNPDDGKVVVNHYELEEDNAYDSVKGDNAYDSANPPGSSASTSKPPEDTMPPVYAAVDKDNRKGKTLYATLDSVALESDGSQKRKDDRPPPTEYADINFLKKKPDQNAGEAV